MNLLRSETPMARKHHRCDWCAEPILPGEKHSAQTCADEGTVFTVRNHLECQEALTRLCRELVEDRIEGGEIYHRGTCEPK